MRLSITRLKGFQHAGGNSDLAIVKEWERENGIGWVDGVVVGSWEWYCNELQLLWRVAGEYRVHYQQQQLHKIITEKFWGSTTNYLEYRQIQIIFSAFEKELNSKLIEVGGSHQTSYQQKHKANIKMTYYDSAAYLPSCVLRWHSVKNCQLWKVFRQSSGGWKAHDVCHGCGQDCGQIVDRESRRW